MVCMWIAVGGAPRGAYGELCQTFGNTDNIWLVVIKALPNHLERAQLFVLTHYVICMLNGLMGVQSSFGVCALVRACHTSFNE